MSITVRLIATTFSAPQPVSADEPVTTLDRTGWEVSRPYSPIHTATFTTHGDIGFYDLIPEPGVPTADAARWSDCGPSSALCPNADTIGMSQPSRLGDGIGFFCLKSADFTFFQSFVSIPVGTDITQFSVNMDQADDGARVAIYNSANPGGLVLPGAYVFLGGAQSTTDLSLAMVAGEVNRVVITQVDDCATGNNLGFAEILLNGEVVTQPPPDADGDGVPDGEDDFINSDLSPTVVVDGCDSGVANVLLSNGATMNDLIGEAVDKIVAAGGNHGQVVKAVSVLTRGWWKTDGIISGRDHGKITSCIARTDFGKTKGH